MSRGGWEPEAGALSLFPSPLQGPGSHRRVLSWGVTWCHTGGVVTSQWVQEKGSGWVDRMGQGEGAKVGRQLRTASAQKQDGAAVATECPRPGIGPDS